MKKKIFTFFLFLFLSSCGYEATYSLKNRSIYAFSISELVLTGDRQINLKIKQLLNPYTNPKIKEEKNSDYKNDHETSRPEINTPKNSKPNQVVKKTQPVRVEQKINRNDPCPCGSGKKYKKCHGK